MVKRITEILIKKVVPNLPEEHKKWINVFNEAQYRIDTLFEALVSWYSGSLFLMHIDHENLDKSRELMPLRLKIRIFEGYLYVELWNLLDPNGESSITKFVNYWTADINKGGKEFADIFQGEISIDDLQEHFKVFKKWIKENKEEINHFRYMRNKNFSHIDHSFEYENKVSFEYMIETISFISDYLSKLILIMKMINIRVVKGEPVGTQQYLIKYLDIDILGFRFRQELDGLLNYYRISGKGRQIFLLNCYDSIEETLKRVNLVKID